MFYCLWSYDLFFLKYSLQKTNKKNNKHNIDPVKQNLHSFMFNFSIFPSLFEKTQTISGDAVMAANAYKTIVDAIADAKKSADKALEDAQASKKIVSLMWFHSS